MTQVDAETLMQKMIHSDVALLDVRSEGEFDKGHFVGSYNVPILHNEHRHDVGLCYKTQGQEAAIRLGHALTDPIRDRLLEEWLLYLQESPAEYKALTCWRGGLRSEIAQRWLLEAGYSIQRVSGGYQSLRRWALRYLDALQIPPMLVLSGASGVGKTELLHQLAEHRETSLGLLDLEAIARHRGSVFGAYEHLPQPEQATFENQLAMTLGRLESTALLLVEDESRNLGRCFLPTSLYEALLAAPTVELVAPMEQRIDRLLTLYVLMPLQQQMTPEALHQRLREGLQRLSRRLGGLVYQKISGQMQAAFDEPIVRTLNEQGRTSLHRQWIASLLTDYYDRAYEFARQRANRKTLYRAEAGELSQWLLARARGGQ